MFLSDEMSPLLTENDQVSSLTSRSTNSPRLSFSVYWAEEVTHVTSSEPTHPGPSARHVACTASGAPFSEDTPAL